MVTFWNGFTLYDNTAPDGGKIESDHDVVDALSTFPAFQTVHTDIIWEAFDLAMSDRKHYQDITEFADFLAKHFLNRAVQQHK